MHVNVTSTLYKHYSYNKIVFAFEKFFYICLPPELSEESFYFHSELFNHLCWCSERFCLQQHPKPKINDVSVSLIGMHLFFLCFLKKPPLPLPQAAAGHGPAGPSNQELRALWVTDHRGKDEREKTRVLGGMDWLADRRRTGTTVPAVSTQTITLSPRGASGGFSVFTVLPFRDVNCGSRPVMTEWGGNNSGHLLSVLQFDVHIISLSVF